MRRELLLLEEMIDAAEQAHVLAAGQIAQSLATDRQRRDALLWNFTVMGEAAVAGGSRPPEAGAQVRILPGVPAR